MPAPPSRRKGTLLPNAPVFPTWLRATGSGLRWRFPAFCGVRFHHPESGTSRRPANAMSRTKDHAMPNAAYSALDARSYRSSALTRGPWHPEHQHAGPPIALVCRALEQAAQVHGLAHISRLTANLLRPVPIGELVGEV